MIVPLARKSVIAGILMLRSALELEREFQGGFSLRASSMGCVDPGFGYNDEAQGDPMKTVSMEDATLDRCVAEAQQEKVILTRNGHPIALIVSVDGMDEEQIRLSSDPEFWKLMEERRRQKTISREELERRLDQVP
jgi:antitoxin (DNA-binding transcriptional repressor) of toxin-antitoxin stability system